MKTVDPYFYCAAHYGQELRQLESADLTVKKITSDNVVHANAQR